MNYYNKYIKYKQKYIQLKNQIGGNYTHIIALLWINKNKGPIQQINRRGEDLGIKENIIRTYNMFKIKYSNPKVILFINLDKYIEGDLEELKTAGVEMFDIGNMEIIKHNEKLRELLYPELYGRNPCPIYQQVDMLKILIQYEFMTNPLYNYDYVVFSDLDAQDKDSLNPDNMACKPDRPDWIDEYYPDKIFDSPTIKLLDIFGYLMNGDTEELFEHDEKLSTNAKNELCKYGVYQRNSIVKLNNKIFAYNFNNPENMFLISKKNSNVIKAIKEYFIDHLFCNIMFNSNCDVDSRNFIFGKYDYFNQYLNFLQGLIFYKIIINDKYYNQLVAQTNLIEDTDYKYKKVENINEIDILSPQCFEYFRNVLFDGGFGENWRGLLSYDFNPFPTLYGLEILKQYAFNIEYSTGRRWLKPFKCIPIERSTNSIGVK